MGEGQAAFPHDTLDLLAFYVAGMIIKQHRLFDSLHETAGVKGIEQTAIALIGF